MSRKASAETVRTFEDFLALEDAPPEKKIQKNKIVHLETEALQGRHPEPGPLAFKADPYQIAASLINYFEQSEFFETEETHTDREGNSETQTVTHRRSLPTLESWCLEHRMTTSALKGLAELHTVVQDAIDFARDAMKAWLIRNGLTSDYDPRFAIFVATNETDMKVKSEQTHRVVRPGKILEEIEAGQERIVEGDFVPLKDHA
jgi:hypothetical protein